MRSGSKRAHTCSSAIARRGRNARGGAPRSVHRALWPRYSVGSRTRHGRASPPSPWHYWLWTRWLWDARYGTGILPLLASSSHALEGQSIGVQYRQLRPLIALGAELGRNSGLICADLADDPHIGPFATDAFLAIAYSVYLYGITNWRLSREFNRLLPSVPQLARRLLGLPKLAESRP